MPEEHNTHKQGAVAAASLRRELWQRAKRMKLLYLFFLIPLINFFIFRYIPMYGVTIAFKDYKISKGIIGSEWNNFEHFRDLFKNPFFVRILRNTLIISLYRIVFSFPFPILLALLLNELGKLWFKRLAQSILYLPHFMSWVVLAGILIEVLSPQTGVLGHTYNLMGKRAPNLLTSQAAFRPLLIITGIWQQAGWGTVIYLAAITSIDPGLYESAAIDGAGRFRMAIHITLPMLAPVITILFILRLGQILNAGFDQIFNLYNPLVYEVADIIDTYVFREGILGRKFDFSTAVGLFKNVIGVMLIVVTNSIIKRSSEYGIW